MRIVIPMSGIGKRFLEAGYTDPKPLIEVDGRPMIHHVIDLFPGETNFHFICNDEHLATTRMREILLEKVPTAHIHEVSIQNRKGPVDAVLQIADQLPEDEEIILSYCDYGSTWDYLGFLNEMRKTHSDGGIAAYIGFHPHMLGSDNYAFLKHYNKWVTSIQEKKPYTENKMNEYASNGTYYFRTGALMKRFCRQVVEQDLSVNGEYYASLVMDCMCQARLNVRVFEIEKMLQWGTPKDLEEYKQWSEVFRKQRKEPMKHGAPIQATTILPMAGAGSRFHMVGYTDPKPLLRVNGSPMFIEAVNCLPPTESIVFVCQQAHLDAYPIQSNVKESKVIGIPTVTEGQACTCEIAIRDGIPLDKSILISACDNGVLYDVAKHAALVADPSIDVIVWAFTNSQTGTLYPHMYAWLDVDSEGRIHEVSIKKPFANKPNTHAIIGTMFFRTGELFMEGLDECYKTDNRTNGEFYVDNVLQPLIAKGYTVRVFEVDHYLCWGTPNDYKTYQYWDTHFDKIHT